MLFRQLKTLIWRNTILKKRGYFFTLLEIILPILIVLFITKNSREHTTKSNYETIDNVPPYIVNNSTRIANLNIKNQYLISFSKDFDTQKQNIFIENFKKNKYLSSFKYIESNVNFTKSAEKNYVLNNFGELIEPNYHHYKRSIQYTKSNNKINNNNININDINKEETIIQTTTTNTNTTINDNDKNNNNNIDNTINNNNNNNINININNNNNNNNNINNTNIDNNENSNNKCVNEYKIKIFNDEKDLFNDYRIMESNSDSKDYDSDIKTYAICFKSLTKFTLYINENKDLITKLVSELQDANSYNYFIFQILTSDALTKTLINIDPNNNINLNPNNNMNSKKIPEIEFNFKSMDNLGYEKTVTYNSELSFVPISMIFLFAPCICCLLNNLVMEKESKIKESLVIVGLKRSAFWISWMIIYGVIIIIASSIVTIILYSSKVFVYVHWSIILFVVIIYGLTCITIPFILSTLISKSKTSNTISALVILSFLVLYILNSVLTDNSTSKWICCIIFPTISFISFLEYIIKFEEQNLSLSFINMFKDTILKKYVFALIGSFFIYLLVAIYLDNVLPQGNNLHKKWHYIITDPLRFCFSKKKNRSQEINSTNQNNIKNNNNNNNNNPYIQKDPEGLRKAVEINHIGKEFKVKGENMKILRDINFNAYYDEIFAILGHNGAGKTTLLRIMTGGLSATHGEVYYDNIPIQGNETEICQQFGYCPQFDTFSKNLTVGEHVKLFAGIKGIQVDVDEILRDIDLLSKKNNFPKQLSGGQRRKFCITLALLGSPKYVFLDEPTTGLDPYSRKSIWELLSRKKKGCTMFVTTHYMDEADLLADRKMIISNGNITCLGSSIFLKNIFNMNYSLDITLTNKSDYLRIDPIIDYYCPGFSKTKVITTSHYNINENQENQKNHNNIYYNNCNNNNNIKENNNNNKVFIITYLLPMKRSKYFKDIFIYLNKMISDKNTSISNFSLTAPTLEELFIKLEENKEIHSNPRNENIQEVNNAMDDDKTKLISSLDPIFGKTNMNKSSSLRQILSIMTIRIKIFLRNKTFALIYTLIPILLIVVSIFIEYKYINSLYGTVEYYKPLEIKPTLYDRMKWFKNPTTSNGIASDIINKIDSSNLIKLNTVDYDKELTIASNQLSQNQNQDKYIGGFSGIVNGNQDLEFTIYSDIKYKFGISIGIQSIYNAFLEQNNFNQKLDLSFNSFPYYNNARYSDVDQEKILNIAPEEMKIKSESKLSLAIAIAISLSISIYGPFTVKEREDGITWQLYLNGTKRLNYWIGIFLSDFLCLIVPIIVIGIAGYINDVSIFIFKILPYTIVITLLWIIGSLIHQYAVSYFFKRYDKCSNLFVIINPVLTLAIGLLAMSLCSTEFEISQDPDFFKRNPDDEKTYSMMKKILYIISIFYTPSTLVFYYSKINNLVGIRKLNITENTFSAFINSIGYKDIMKNSKLNKVEREKRLAKVYYSQNIPSLNDILKSEHIKISLIMAISLIILYLLIHIIKSKVNKKIMKSNRSYTPEERKPKDKKLKEGPRDVYNEFLRVQESIDENAVYKQNGFINTLALKIYRINKDYIIKKSEMKKRKKEIEKENECINVDIDIDGDDQKKKRKLFNRKNGDGNGNGNENNKEKSAFEKMDNRVIYDEKLKKYINRIVDDVTFGVDNGQCLGLLGPNGAGKTTCISMMTGNVTRTHGRVIYGNKELSNTDLADLSLGYCSQYDSLWKLLTVKETIEFYLNICGYPRRDIPRYTEALIEACGIEYHTHKKVSEISGGTKRKLSLIISICSSPDYLILDEPSAGMDPFTRRYMWKLISQLKKVRETATILTTHSTEEAEALCDRIAILIKGNLVCIDTPRSIKMNQSHRYVLEVFTKEPKKFEELYINKYNIFGLDFNSGEKYEVERSFDYHKYTVEMQTETIAKIFFYMEHAKENGIISQYNFGQYSLEQVFIDFVNKSE